MEDMLHFRIRVKRHYENVRIRIDGERCGGMLKPGAAAAPRSENYLAFFCFC
jgi:hypothetical protein